MVTRYDGSGYGRGEFVGGGDYGFFGGYPSAPPASGPFQPAPPSLMSVTTVPPLMPAAAGPPPPIINQPAGLAPSVLSHQAISGNSRSSAGVNTNSRHPLAIKARVFIGNLNTNVVTRDEIELLYRRFGELTAVSIHRGYAFVQFVHEYEARNAISFTDGMMLGGQRLDVNLAAEPKSGRDMKGNKRHAESGASDSIGNVKRLRSSGGVEKISAVTSNVPKPLFPSNKTISCNVEVSSNKSATKPVPMSGKSTASVAAAKKPDSAHAKAPAPTKTVANKQVQPPQQHANGASADTNVGPCSGTSGAADILICGGCRAMFDHVEAFAKHKKISSAICQKSVEHNGTSTETEPATKSLTKPEGEPDVLLCFICQSSFDHAWNLIVHIGQEHNITVYHTSKSAKSTATKSDTASETGKTEKPDVAKDTTTKTPVKKEESKAEGNGESA